MSSQNPPWDVRIRDWCAALRSGAGGTSNSYAEVLREGLKYMKSKSNNYVHEDKKNKNDCGGRKNYV